MKKNRWFHSIMCLLILILFPSLSVGYGSPDYLPDGNRPRIWLSSNELSNLAKIRDNFSQESDWTALKNWCDDHINDSGYGSEPVDQTKYDLTNWGGDNSYVSGYRMSGFAKHLYSYALAYQVLIQPGTKRDILQAGKYADRAKTLLIDGICKALRAGEEPNGLKALRVGSLHDVTINKEEAVALNIGYTSYKMGYSSRNLMAVPVAYDWIHDTLSEVDRLILVKMMLRWFDWTRGVRSEYNNGVSINGIRYYEDQGGDCTGNNNCTSLTSGTKAYAFGNVANNFGSGHDAMLSLIAVATYGDIPEPSNHVYIQALKTHISINTIQPLENDLIHSGGDSPEGWNYGGGYMYLVMGLYGYATATGDPIVESMKWPSDLIRAACHRVSNDFLTTPLYGYWTGTPLGKARRYILLRFVWVEQKFRPSSSLSSLGQFLLETPEYEDSLEAWESLLFNSQGVQSKSPAILSLSKSYVAKGNGLFATRSNWDDFLASHFTVRLEGKVTASHEGYDEGHFSLVRGGDRLLDHDNKSDSPQSVTFNTIVFNNISHHAMNPPQLKPAIDRVKDGEAYAYVSGDVTNAFKRQYKADSAKFFRRSVLHIRPDIYVIYDVTQSNSAVGNLKEWYTQYSAEPTISDNTITVTKGDSKAYIQTIYPTGGVYTKSVPASGFWRVKYTPATLNEYDQFLHVIEAASRTNLQTPLKAIHGDGGRGVLIGSTAAIFTCSPNGSDIQNVKYTTNAMTHYITDLPVEKEITVLCNGNVLSNTTTDSAGLIKFSTNGSDASYEVRVEGAVNPVQCIETPGFVTP